MAKANRAAARVVKERMKAERPDDVKILQTVDKADIIVVRGQYDRVEDVLTTLKIAHVVVSPGEVAGLTLNAKQLLSSAYSSQQMTTNLVIERKKDQGRVEGLYGKSYQPSTTAAPRKVKVLEQKGRDTKVRTMDGEEQWVPTATWK